MKEDGKAEPSLNSSTLTKMCVNAARLCLESASWLLMDAALFFFLLIHAMREHRFRKLTSPYYHEKSISSASRRKVRFAAVFPRGIASVSHPIDCSGNVITPQVSSYPWRALISPAPEQLTTANVFLTSITSARKAFIPAYGQEVKICASTRYQTPSKIERSFFYTCQDLDLRDLLKSFQCYHLQGKKWSLQSPSCSCSSSPRLSHKQEPKGDQWRAVPGY